MRKRKEYPNTKPPEPKTPQAYFWWAGSTFVQSFPFDKIKERASSKKKPIEAER